MINSKTSITFVCKIMKTVLHQAEYPTTFEDESPKNVVGIVDDLLAEETILVTT